MGRASGGKRSLRCHTNDQICNSCVRSGYSSLFTLWFIQLQQITSGLPDGQSGKPAAVSRHHFD
jgi:hypothetical protein